MSESRSFVTSDGVVLVDTKVAGRGQPLIDRIDTFVADVREAKQAGQSAAAVAASWQVPAEFAGFGSPGPERLQAYVQVIFDELE